MITSSTSVEKSGFDGHADGCGILAPEGKAAISGVQCSGNKWVSWRAGAAQP